MIPATSGVMSTVTTIYEQGRLYPLDPLPLPDTTKVQVQIVPYESVTVPTAMQTHYLFRLRSTLMQLTRSWTQDMIYQAYVNIFRDDLMTLWQLSLGKQSELCATLMLAIQSIHIESLSPGQVDAIQFVLDKIGLDTLNEADMMQCHLKLLNVHLFLTASLDEEALQDYLDEL